MNDYYSLSAMTLLVGQQEGHLTCKKKLGVGLLVVTFWVQLCTSYSSSCRYHLHHLPMKSRMETFWYQLTQVYMEN